MPQPCSPHMPVHATDRRGRRDHGWLGWLLVAATALFPFQVQATSVQALTLQDLVSGAQLVVVAKAARSESRWAEGGKMIVTDVELQVEETVLGTAKAGGTLLLTHLGGRIGDVALTVPSAPKFKPGLRALIFLADNGKGGLRLVGFHQGLMEIYRDGGVERVKAGVTDGHQVTRDSTGKLVDAESAIADQPALRSLIDRIRTLAGK